MKSEEKVQHTARTKEQALLISLPQQHISGRDGLSHQGRTFDSKDSWYYCRSYVLKCNLPPTNWLLCSPLNILYFKWNDQRILFDSIKTRYRCAILLLLIYQQINWGGSFQCYCAAFGPEDAALTSISTVHGDSSTTS
jgi:hypothetical protein